MFYIKQKYDSGHTLIQIENEPMDMMDIPALTFCIQPAFKKKESTYSEEDFLANTYSLEDIFDANALETMLSNGSHYKVSVIRSYMYGRCFTVQNLRPQMTTGQLEGNNITLLRNWDVTLFIHQPGEEFWILRSIFPIPMSTLTIRSGSNNDWLVADVHLKKITSSFVAKTNRIPCRNYPSIRDDTFTSCFKHQVRDLLMESKQLQCITPCWKSLGLPENFPICTDRDNYYNDSFIVLREILDNATQNPHLVGCPKPCQKVEYKLQINYFSKNGLTHMPDDRFKVYTYYDDMSVEKQTEYIYYDKMAVLADIGGMLGLLLGYSLLSIVHSSLSGVETLLTYKSK